MDLFEITDHLARRLKRLSFGPPVTHVYNPLEYAHGGYDAYLRMYAGRPKEVVMVGMNPGPWGMAQTGVPFGEVTAVREWMGIETSTGRPKKTHPKRPVDGFQCKRREVSGKRLWGWAKKRFGTAENFFSRFFVANYCPLMFIDKDGRNRTPDNIRASEQKPLLSLCDSALRETIAYFKPRYVVGIGQFAAGRMRIALADADVISGRITHPSPANPKANRGWETLMESELRALGIRL